MKIYPYPQIPVSSVEAGHWTVMNLEGEQVPVGRHIEYWEPGLTTRLASAVRVPAQGVPQQLRPVVRSLACFARIDCPPTGGRVLAGATATREGDSWVWRLEADAAAGTLAGHITLSRFIVPTAGVEGLPAGAYVWADRPQTVALEGGGGRFRVVVFPFDTIRELDVPWKVEVTPEEPDDLLRSCAEVWVNSQHPAGAAVLKGRGPEWKLANSVMKADLMEAVLQACMRLRATSEGAIPDPEEGEDTIWWSADRMCRTFLKRSLEESMALADRDPQELRLRIRQATKFLQGVGL